VPQIGGVIGSIGEEPLGWLRSPDQALRGRAIVRFTTSQQGGKKTAFSICDCVDFRVAPAARASNRLALFPLFAPDAERWALMCVLSII